MAEINTIPLADLLIDAENPRLPQPNVGQHEALRAIAKHQGRKLQALAEDIQKHGFNPADLSIVMPLKDDPKRFVVLEGNRRLTAVRALENPAVLEDAVEPAALAEIRKLSKLYQATPLDSATCVIVKDRDEARHWIELRHTGENAGAGIVRWDTHEKDRFLARTGGLEPHTQALDFLERRGDLTSDLRKAVPATSFRRLVGTPEVRAKLGLHVRDGKLYRLADEKKVAAALLYVAKDLASQQTKTQDIYTKKLRIEYAEKLPKHLVVHAAVDVTGAIPIEAETPLPKGKPPAPKVAKPRDKLIPRDCVLNITEARLRDIERELRRLSLSEFKNAVSVLFRVFIELSADSYIHRLKMPTSIDASLAKKLQDVVQDLVVRKKLTTQQAKPVNKACAAQGLLAPSVKLMHEYVHNQWILPEHADLRSAWDSLQPFVTAIWAP
jgi:hypothetical protein